MDATELEEWQVAARSSPQSSRRRVHRWRRALASEAPARPPQTTIWPPKTAATEACNIHRWRNQIGILVTLGGASPLPGELGTICLGQFNPPKQPKTCAIPQRKARHHASRGTGRAGTWAHHPSLISFNWGREHVAVEYERSGSEKSVKKALRTT